MLYWETKGDWRRELQENEEGAVARRYRRKSASAAIASKRVLPSFLLFYFILFERVFVRQPALCSKGKGCRTAPFFSAFRRGHGRAAPFVSVCQSGDATSGSVLSLRETIDGQPSSFIRHREKHFQKGPYRKFQKGPYREKHFWHPIEIVSMQNELTNLIFALCSNWWEGLKELYTISLSVFLCHKSHIVPLNGTVWMILNGKSHLHPTMFASKGGLTNSQVLWDYKAFISSSVALFYLGSSKASWWWRGIKETDNANINCFIWLPNLSREYIWIYDARCMIWFLFL